MRIQRSNLAIAASSSSGQDLATNSAAQNSERDLISALRQVRATGRIVLTLKPDSSGTGSLPDVTMENGDRFVIPPVPSVINVIGAVYDQNSFLYVDGRRVGAYVTQAGGANREADAKREFIIRANGDVVSRDTVNSAWGNEFAKLRLYPGDTIVVPEKTFKPSALRGVLEWSQLFSQLAFGIAAHQRYPIGYTTASFTISTVVTRIRSRAADLRIDWEGSFPRLFLGGSQRMGNIEG